MDPFKVLLSVRAKISLSFLCFKFQLASTFSVHSNLPVMCCVGEDASRCTILPRRIVGQRAAPYQAGKDFELQPSSRNTQDAAAQQKMLVCPVCYGKNPDGDGPPTAQNPQISSHEIPVEREGNGDRRCIHICLNWQVSFQNNTTTHSKKKKK